MLLFFRGGNGTWSLYSRQALYPLATYPTLNLHFLDHTEHLHLFCNKPWFWSQFKTLPWPLRLSENILSWCHFARSCISGCNSFCSDQGKLSELWQKACFWLTGYWTLLRWIPQASDWCPGDRSTFQRKAPESRHRGNQGEWGSAMGMAEKKKNHTEKWIGWLDLCCYIAEV